MLEEAARRLRLRDGIVAATCALLAGGIVVGNGADLARAVRAARTQLAAGVTVFSVEPHDPLAAGLDPLACAGLTGNSAVIAAGASKGEDVTAGARWSPSGLPVSVWDLTPQALQVWWPDMPAAGGLFVGRDLAEVTGLAGGDPIDLGDDVVETVAVLPDTVRPAAWQASLIRTVPATGAGRWECWFRVDPGTGDQAPDLAAAAFPDVEYSIRPFARTDELSTSPLQLLSGSSGRWTWLAAVGIVVALQGVVALAGRGESGIYRATGSRLPDLWLMATVRALILVGVAVPLGAVGGAVVLSADPLALTSEVALWYVLQPVVLFASALLVALPVIDTVAATGSVADTLTG